MQKHIFSGGPILLLACMVNSYMVRAQMPVFQPITDACGIADVQHFDAPFCHGAAAADYDNDGDIDFYLTTAAGETDRLYKNDGHGFFTDVALDANIIEGATNRTALWVDIDGDKLLDLVLAGENCPGNICNNPIRLALYKQQPDHSFQNITTPSGLVVDDAFDQTPFYAVGGLAAGDLNNDQYLDLLLTVWGGGIKYFQNNGDGTFSDKTTAAGLVVEAKTPWQAMLYDFNADGLLDIYCNVDFAPNKLWINTGLGFEERAEAYGLGNSFNEMGMTMGDADNDGDLDIYITNITRSFQGQPQYNLLYRQEKSEQGAWFREVAQGSGVSHSGWDWGTTFADINNDGRQDLFATNGWMETDWPADRSNLWLNSSAGFVDVAAQCQFTDMLKATSLLAFDKDNDGDLDILQTLKVNQGTQKPAIFHQNSGMANAHYSKIQLRHPGANAFGIGSEVCMVADNLRTARLVHAGCSFYGQEPAELHFGLGNRTAIKEVLVRWPGNEMAVYTQVPIDQTVVLDYDFIAAPANLQIVQTGNRATLQWEDHSDNETGFVLHRSADSLFNAFEAVILDQNTTAFTDSLANGHYRVRAFNANVQSIESNAVQISSNNGQALVDSITIAPNPTEGKLRILWPEGLSGIVEMALFDAAGRELWRTTLADVAAATSFEQSLALAPGLYVLWLQNGEKTTWHKILMY